MTSSTTPPPYSLTRRHRVLCPPTVSLLLVVFTDFTDYRKDAGVKCFAVGSSMTG
ncbi:hypothetical protein Droror1_Dr00027349, partial [Drosera rotundifolia]